MQNKDDRGKGGRSFLRMIFKRSHDDNNSLITIVKTSLITGAIWNEEYMTETRHTWIEDETACKDANEEISDIVKGSSRLWKVSCLFNSTIKQIDIQAQAT